MAALPARPLADPTLDAVRVSVEAEAARERDRPYLGASSIGQPCSRRLWYGFRGAASETLTARSAWAIEDGHRSEAVMAGRLRLVKGVHLQTIDPRTGKQFGFVDLGGHFKGHADGLIAGLIQAPVALHVWEHKAVNEEKFGKLAKLKTAPDGEKAALAAWDPAFHAQAVLYMAYFEAKRHYLTCSTPGARDVISVRTDSDLDAARRLRQKAERIILAPEPPERISENPAWFECKFCPAQSVCHATVASVGGKLVQTYKLPAVRCQTCAHATPEMDGHGRWSCAWHKRDLTKEERDAACPSHRYIPALVQMAKPTDADPVANWIEYTMILDGRKFRNGEPGVNSYASTEMRTMDISAYCDPALDHLRGKFGALHVAA